LLRLQTQDLGEKEENKQNPLLSANASFIPMPEPFQPLFFMVYSRKKEGGKSFGYLRFRRAKNDTTPMMQATATTASMAVSIVMNGDSIACVASVSSEDPASIS
jgi:hypothetical protein